MNLHRMNLREISEIQYESPIDQSFTSRYSVTRVIQSKTNSFSPHHESWNSVSIPETSMDIYITVSLLEENRLDLISKRVYGSPLYWWIIAVANDMLEVFEIPTGSVLRVPPMSSVFSTKGLLM